MPMEKNYNIDDHLRHSLRDFSDQPAKSSFQAMMEKLEQKRKRRKALILLYSGIGTLAAVVLAICLVNVFATSKQINPTAEIKTSVSKNEAKSPLTINETKELSEEVEKRKEIFETKKPVGLSNLPVTTSVSNSENEKSQNKTTVNTIKAKKPENNNITASMQNAPSVALTETLVLKQSENKPPTKMAIAENRTTQEESATAETNSGNQTSDNKTETESKINDEPVHQLSSVAYALPGSSLDTGLMPTPLNPLALDYAPGLMRNNKRFRFLLAINLNPQYSRYLLSENKRSGAVYKSGSGKSISESYLESKREMNTPKFTYAYGLKAGINIQDQWEVWLGLGFQKVRFNETLYQMAFTNTTTISGGVAPPFQSTSADPVGTVKISYRYSYYSLEIKRIAHISPFLKLNYGAGVWFERMSSVHVSSRSSSGTSGYFYDTSQEGLSSMASSGCRLDVKGGVIYDFGDRWQFRLNPGIFYSPTSVFNRSYVIKQKMYGLELEALLVFKLYRD